MGSTYGESGTVSSIRGGLTRPDRRARSLRSRRRAFMETVALIVIAALLIAGTYASRVHSKPAVSTTEVRAEAGDTLWSIARSHPVDGLTTADTVDMISRMNGLADPRVTPGARLSVPDAATTTLLVASN